MIDTEMVKDLTQEQMQKIRDQATMVLINNQECYVAQWILQNPFLKMSDYYLKFEPEQGNINVYKVSMEKKPDVQ